MTREYRKRWRFKLTILNILKECKFYGKGLLVKLLKDKRYKKYKRK